MSLEKIMRIRQGVLKAKVVLKTATERQRAEYDALVRLYGTHWTAGRVCYIMLCREEWRLTVQRSKSADEFAKVFENGLTASD